MKKKSMLKRILSVTMTAVVTVSLAIPVFATSYTDGKYTNSITKATSISYYTMTGLMRVTSGRNSNEAIAVRIRRLKSNGDYTRWVTETSSNAIALRVDATGMTSDGSRGWQGGFKAGSFRTNPNATSSEIRHFYKF